MGITLRDRVIVITGASSGIGAATAIACAAAGMHVVLNGRNEERLARVADQVRQHGREAEIVAGDVTAAGMSDRVLDAAERRFGSFHAVFANAGYGFGRAVHETDDAELRALFDVNFFAANDLLRAAARRLLAAERPGHLLMCSSCLSKFTFPHVSAYSATKAAQNHVCQAMRLELHSHGIAVSSVHPISTQTDFDARARELTAALGGKVERASASHDWMRQPPDRVARAVVRCLRRPRPEVWTSFTVRGFAALATLFPGITGTVARFRR